MNRKTKTSRDGEGFEGGWVTCQDQYHDYIFKPEGPYQDETSVRSQRDNDGRREVEDGRYS